MHDKPYLQSPDDEHAQLVAESFRLLADATRIKIIWVLLQGESSVNCLAELVQASPTAVSQHLAKLRLARLVESRREGNFVYYSANDEHVHALLSEGLSHAEHVTGHVEPTGQDEASHHYRGSLSPGSREATG